MKELLLEFLSTILKEVDREFKAVKKGKDGKERVVPFGSKENMDRAIAKPAKDGATYRPYNPATDGKLETEPVGKIGSMGKDPAAGISTQLKKDFEDPEKRAVMMGKSKPTSDTKPSATDTGTPPEGIPAPEGAENLNTADLAKLIQTGIVAPGNDFSKYSEAVSTVAAKIVIDDSEKSDEEILTSIVKMDCNSATFTKKVGAAIPKTSPFYEKYIEAKNSGVFESGCDTKYSESQNMARYMTMVVARAKANKMLEAMINLENTDDIKNVSIDTFSGDANSLRSLRKAISSATGQIYTETGPISREQALELISGFGTSKFPADTALIGKDDRGNLILMAFSDKKDLSAIINNSTVSTETTQTLALLDTFLNDKKISAEEHKKLTDTVKGLQDEYEKAEAELKQVTASPANVLVDIAENDPKQFNELIKKVKRLSTSETDPAKYWNSQVAPFQENAKKKPTASVEEKYLQWLRKAGWDGSSPVTDQQAFHAFALKCQAISNFDDKNLPDDEVAPSLSGEAQTILFRMGHVDRTEMMKQIGDIRNRSLDILTNMRKELNSVSVTIGESQIPIGNLMDAARAWKGLHLDMAHYNGALSMVAEDNVVDYETLASCMGGISSMMDFAKQLDVTTEPIMNTEFDITTGQRVEVFSVTPTGAKVKVGVRSIRSKNGPLGRLQTTWTYHPDFQRCLESNQ
jgi:hypothetical protein